MKKLSDIFKKHESFNHQNGDLFFEVDPHKLFQVHIVEDGAFQFIISQWWIDSKEDFKNNVVNPNVPSSRLMMGLSYPEFCVLARVIIYYCEQFESTSDLVKQLSVAKKFVNSLEGDKK
jgi:hypothetical protein